MKTSQQEEETYPQFEILKELIASQQYEKAKNEYLNSDEALAKINDASAHETRLNLLIDYCYLLTETGHALFEEKKMFGIFDVCFNRQNRREAIKAFEDIREIIIDRLSLLQFNDPSNDRSALLTLIENASESLEHCELDKLPDTAEIQLDEYNQFACNQYDGNTQFTIDLLGSAVCFSVSYRRSFNTALLDMQRGLGVGIVILLGIAYLAGGFSV